MAKTVKYSFENETGCGFMGVFFHLRGLRPRNAVIFQDTPQSKKQLDTSKSAKPQPQQAENPTRAKPRPSGAARSSTSSQLVVNSSYTRKLTKEPTFTSSELSLTIRDHPNGALYRASTGNVMLLGHLGNLKQRGKKGNHITKKSLETMHHQIGNILRSPRKKLNPDVIKSSGNEKYRQGKYEEALALYSQAISIDPKKACYYSNKSAALMGLGRVLEAVVQCREAIRIDSSYHNAHCRLANLYLRLGVADKAIYHYKCSGRKAGRKDVSQAEALNKCIERCIEAYKHGDWLKLLNESQAAISLGADSAPQIYALKAEALLKLQRHEEAYSVMQNAPHFAIELYASLFCPSAAADLLKVRALVYMANGRFEDAVSVVEQALRIDSTKSINSTAERVKSVASARQNGNRLFKGSRFSEALIAYNKGLEKDPHNSVLLCNRAACRSKLGQYEKALEDCTAALTVRPSYIKARLRRANCHAQMGKWEAAIEDYEMVMQETPGDEEVRAALLEAKMHLNNQHNGQALLKTTKSEAVISNTNP